MLNVHGIVLSRDDWGLLAVSICHALEKHVSVVHVLNHASLDQTAAGLAFLKEIYGDRLKIYSTGVNTPFEQSVLTNFVASIAEQSKPDWIYVFDSDEFLINCGTLTLQEELEKLPENVVSARYEVNNLISFHDFNRFDLSCYEAISYRAIPKLNNCKEHPYDLIYKDKATFFDFPFISKVIYRANKNLWIQDGAHLLARIPPECSELKLESFYCAHLTLPDRTVLSRKAAMGRDFIEMGLDKNHGWQSQLLYRLFQENKLDYFWENHSIGNSNKLKDDHQKDQDFAAIIKDSITLLRKHFLGNDISKAPRRTHNFDENSEQRFGFTEVLSTYQNFVEKKNSKSQIVATRKSTTATGTKSKFNVCIVKPDDYIHSYAFLELGELLLYSLRELGYDTTMKFKEMAGDRTNILIGCHLLNTSLINKVAKSTIILNTEQIYSDDTPWNSNIFEWVKHFEVWDYSTKNIEKLKSLGISNLKHLKIGFQKELQRIKKSPVQDIDVLFYGSRNERRNQTLEELKLKGLKVETLFGVYGADRDSYIGRSKVVLNHHFYKSQIFEIVRVFYLLHNEVAVVAEINDTTHVEDFWKGAVSGAPYNNLVDLVLDLVTDQSRREVVEKNGLEQIKKFPQHIYTAQMLGA